MVFASVTAPFVLDGPMDGPYFLAYVEQILAPTLKKGQIIFLDNVSTRRFKSELQQGSIDCMAE
jgi:hypothetical protein